MGCRLILVALALFVWVASGISVAAATDQMDEIDAKSRLRDLEELLNVWLAPLTSDVQELAKRLRRVEEKLPTVLASQSVDWSRVRACQSDVSPRVKAFHEQLLTAVKASVTRMEETGAEYRRHQDEYRQAQARRVDQVALIDMYFNQKVRYHEALQARSRVTRVMAIVEAFIDMCINNRHRIHKKAGNSEAVIKDRRSSGRFCAFLVIRPSAAMSSSRLSGRPLASVALKWVQTNSSGFRSGA